MSDESTGIQLGNGDISATGTVYGGKVKIPTVLDLQIGDSATLGSELAAKITNPSTTGLSGDKFLKRSGTDGTLSWADGGGSGGTITDVKVDNVSVVSSGVANINGKRGVNDFSISIPWSIAVPEGAMYNDPTKFRFIDNSDPEEEYYEYELEYLEDGSYTGVGSVDSDHYLAVINFYCETDEKTYVVTNATTDTIAKTSEVNAGLGQKITNPATSATTEKFLKRAGDGTLSWSDSGGSSISAGTGLAISSGAMNIVQNDTGGLTIVGIPSLNNGDLSGITTSKFAHTSNVFNPQSNNWEMVICFTTDDIVGYQQAIVGSKDHNFDPVVVRINTDARLMLELCSSTTQCFFTYAGSYSLSRNTKYWIKVVFSGTRYVLSYSTNGTDYVEDVATNSSELVYGTYPLAFGIECTSSPGNISAPFGGTIHLRESYIKIGTEYFWNGNINGVAKATDSLFGLVKPDGTTITVSGGVISANVTGKADKVASATNGNFAGLDANGNLTDSGKKAADFDAAGSASAAQTAAIAACVQKTGQSSQSIEGQLSVDSLYVGGTKVVVVSSSSEIPTPPIADTLYFITGS